MGKTVNLQELAEITGFAVQTLIRWQKDEGMPVMLAGQRGRGNEYDTSAVITWLTQRELHRVGLSSPKDELDRARKIEVEIRIGEKLDMLAPAATFERLWGDHIEAAKTELLLLPGKVADAIFEAHDVEVDEQLILPLVEQCLAKLQHLDEDEDGDPDAEHSGDAGDDDEDDDDS
ncbi:terminase small subunit [Cupriavidus pinatubonensis]|uniref:terminase small subunit n=1 Tax=Cupriavidus pinatubonensis TaxID=248026 RepID=UPI001C72A0F2|nr:terminase small subunit [Cupriavidus pinatubonensis]QYY30318.1 terminase small subunit [Cupriavidus pinatubonensis]